MTTTQNPVRVGSTTGWVPISKRPPRSRYPLAGLEVAEPPAAATKPCKQA